jgi:hypothetical protein
MITMNESTPDNLPSLSASHGNRTILRLNRIAFQHFHEGRFPEASECFLSAMQVLKRVCSASGEQQDLSSDDHRTLDLPDTWQESTYQKMTRLGAVLQPMNFCDLYLPLQLESSIQSEEICSRYTLIGFVLIFNLATTIHHHALVFEEQGNIVKESTVSRGTLVIRALRLYRCAFEGVSVHNYPSRPSELDKTSLSRQIVLGQQLLLSTIHNMGLLLGSEEKSKSLIGMTENNSNSNRDSLPSSYRCFQIAFATIQSLSVYYGIQHSDFPPDFELQLVIDTALHELQSSESRKKSQSNDDDDNPWIVHSDTAPCA